MLADGVARLRGIAAAALRPGPMGRADGAPGHGRGRQGWRGQARDVRRQSAGLRGACVQGAQRRGAGTRFPVATGKALPRRGRIGIFNRSHYEEVLVVRVHPEMLERQKLPPSATGKNIWKHRFKDIRAFEHHLARNGTLVLKFHLRISKEEQRKRFLARLDEPVQALEVFDERRRRARALGRLHGGLRGHDPRNLDRLCAMVRHAGRPQACRLAGGLRGDHRGAGRPQARISRRSPARRSRS